MTNILSLKLYKYAFNPWSILLSILIIIFSYNFLDLPIANYFHTLHLNTQLPELELFTELGKGMPYVVLFAGLIILYKYLHPNEKWQERCWFLLLCVLLPNIVCLILKVSLGRARPELWFSANQFGFYWFKWDKLYWSFPSSHTTTVIGLIFGLTVLFPYYRYAFLIPGLIIIASRVLLNHHYLSDILAAIYLTTIEISILVYVLRRVPFLKKMKGASL